MTPMKTLLVVNVLMMSRNFYIRVGRGRSYDQLLVDVSVKYNGCQPLYMYLSDNSGVNI